MATIVVVATLVALVALGGANIAPLTFLPLETGAACLDGSPYGALSQPPWIDRLVAAAYFFCRRHVYRPGVDTVDQVDRVLRGRWLVLQRDAVLRG